MKPPTLPQTVLAGVLASGAFYHDVSNRGLRFRPYLCCEGAVTSSRISFSTGMK